MEQWRNGAQVSGPLELNSQPHPYFEFTIYRKDNMTWGGGAVWWVVLLSNWFSLSLNHSTYQAFPSDSPESNRRDGGTDHNICYWWVSEFEKLQLGNWISLFNCVDMSNYLLIGNWIWFSVLCHQYLYLTWNVLNPTWRHDLFSFNVTIIQQFWH